MMGWQWHQLDHMQIICTSLQTDNHTSTSPLRFLQAGYPSCHPTKRVKSLKTNGKTNYKLKKHYPIILLNQGVSPYIILQQAKDTSFRFGLWVRTRDCLGCKSGAL